MSLTSLIFGIIGLFGSWCLFGIPSIVAVVLGHVATTKTRRGLRSGHGLAVGGLVLGYIVLVPALIVSGVIITHPETPAQGLNDVFDGLSG
ncbi:DUF4190 domain-containing protein [Nonomuraea sp. NPDC049695]|uniref:DUF4190 domain-containing protein n=1 Tax=Nonomuraea sp. NPDC049695 TaxID=3154734 RepID=UPI0034269180